MITGTASGRTLAELGEEARESLAERPLPA